MEDIVLRIEDFEKETKGGDDRKKQPLHAQKLDNRISLLILILILVSIPFVIAVTLNQIKTRPSNAQEIQIKTTQHPSFSQ